MKRHNKFSKPPAGTSTENIKLVGPNDYNKAWQDIKTSLRNGPVISYKLPAKNPTI